MTTTASTRRRTAVGMAAIAAAAALGPASAQAARAPAAACVTNFTATVTPGFTMTPAPGKLSSQGQTGSLECVGAIGGQRITGPGSMGFVEKHSSGSCRSNAGTGKVHLIIPTTAGSKDLVGILAVRRTGFIVRVKVRFPGLRFSGSGVVFPKLGDCATTPLEQIKVTITGGLSQT